MRWKLGFVFLFVFFFFIFFLFLFLFLYKVLFGYSFGVVLNNFASCRIMPNHNTRAFDFLLTLIRASAFHAPSFGEWDPLSHNQTWVASFFWNGNMGVIVHGLFGSTELGKEKILKLLLIIII